MVTHLRIHLGKERELYEQPPSVSEAEQAWVFAVPAWAEPHLARMLAPVNRAGFVRQLGYFQISQRFYVATRYHVADVAFVARQPDDPRETAADRRYPSAGGAAASCPAPDRRAQHRHARLHGSHFRRDPDAGHRLRAVHPPAHQPAVL